MNDRVKSSKMHDFFHHTISWLSSTLHGNLTQWERKKSSSVVGSPDTLVASYAYWTTYAGLLATHVKRALQNLMLPTYLKYPQIPISSLYYFIIFIRNNLIVWNTEIISWTFHFMDELFVKILLNDPIKPTYSFRNY